MQLKVQNALVSDGLREHVRQRIEMAAGEFHDQIEQVAVDLHYSDETEACCDKVCSLSVKLRRSGRLDVTSTAMHFASAIDTAARKLRFRLDEELGARESVEFQQANGTTG